MTETRKCRGGGRGKGRKENKDLQRVKERSLVTRGLYLSCELLVVSKVRQV